MGVEGSVLGRQRWLSRSLALLFLAAFAVASRRASDAFSAAAKLQGKSRPRRAGLRTRIASVVCCGAVLTAAAAEGASAYGWPVRPFHAHHIVSGNFGDPRAPDFHHGIDIRARDGTAVYATLTGTVAAINNKSDIVAIANGLTTFSYWHIVPAVTPGDRAVAYRTVVGRVARGANHVHFAETRGGVYLNPLRRRGGIQPYDDATAPTIRELAVYRRQRRISPSGIAGSITVVADALDWPSLPVALPVGARHLRVAPALVRWRLTRGHRVIIPWRTAADFRRHLPPPERYSATYAPGSRGNWRQHSGRYRFFLLRDWNSASVRNGTYSLSVRVADIRGNAAQARLRLRVQN